MNNLLKIMLLVTGVLSGQYNAANHNSTSSVVLFSVNEEVGKFSKITGINPAILQVLNEKWEEYAQLSHNNDIITIIDFNLPSDKKRLWTIDVNSGKVLIHSLVAHGKNSGIKKAQKFSNTPQSFQSSLGFYLTANSYFGKHGYSLRLKGIEKDINDKAFERAIVVHSADYVSEDFIKANGRLGRSYGCPALPKHINKKFINTTKEGSLLFIYHDTYLEYQEVNKNFES